MPAKLNANKILKQLFDEENDITSHGTSSDDFDDDEIYDHTSDGDDEEKKQSPEMEIQANY